jgi:hypothetical protein
MTACWGIAMIGLLTRLMRIFGRQDNEGSHAATSAAEAIRPLPPAPPQAQVEFVRSVAATQIAPATPVATRPSRHLAPRIAAVARLNAPSARVLPKARSTPASKPKPVITGPVIKHRSVSKPGAVLDRIAKTRRPASAEIIDLAAVRRERHVELLDLDIAAVFN